MFIGLVRKYTRARKLTPRMLNELIEKIEVFNAEKIDAYGSGGFVFTITTSERLRFQRCCPCQVRKYP